MIGDGNGENMIKTQHGHAQKQTLLCMANKCQFKGKEVWSGKWKPISHPTHPIAHWERKAHCFCLNQKWKLLAWRGWIIGTWGGWDILSFHLKPSVKPLGLQRRECQKKRKMLLSRPQRLLGIRLKWRSISMGEYLPGSLPVQWHFRPRCSAQLLDPPTSHWTPSK